MKKIILILLVILGVGVAGFYSYHRFSLGHDHAASGAKGQKYHCPMHPTYVSDKPGDCPICQMRLVPITEEEHQEAVKETAPKERKPLFYRNPMQPEVTSPIPMKDEMGMDYIPVYADDDTAEVPVSGRATIKMSEQREQLIGVRTSLVENRRLNFLVRASGQVAYDPDLYNSIAEYREALKARQKAQANLSAEVRERAESLVNAALFRLRQLGLSQAQIRQIGQSSKAPTNLLVGKEGGAVWVYAQIYEQESGLIKSGQIMDVVSPAFPGHKFTGRVAFVDSIFSAETRTLRVRAEVPNTEGLLKPEMYVDAVIHVELGQKLAIPEEALVDTGTRQLVFVAIAKGQYEPREIQVGHEAEGYYEVLSGLKEGDRVVTSANFLIDSESRLKAATRGGGKEKQ